MKMTDMPKSAIKAIEKLHAPPPSDAAAGSRMGTLNRDVEGGFSLWKKGTRVSVTETPNNTTFLRRLDQGPLGADIVNAMAGVPRDAVTFDSENDDQPDTPQQTKPSNINL